MSLNSIVLPPYMVGKLYGSSLVDQPANTASQKSGPDEKKIAFLGRNEKQILVVTANPDAAYLPDAELAFLSTVLEACGLGIADVAIVNHFKLDGLSYEALIGQLESKKVLLFGIDPVQFGLPVNFPQFQVQGFNGQTYVYAPHLAEIEKDVPLKKGLWMALKKLFSV